MPRSLKLSLGTVTLSIFALLIYLYGSDALKVAQNLPPSSQVAAVSGTGSGLITHYTFDSLALDDASGNNNTATSSGGILTTSGRIGSALNFDGVNDFIYTTTNFTNPQIYTISAWFKTSVASGKKIIGFQQSRSSNTSNDADRQLYMGTDGKIRFGWYPSTVRTVASSAILNDGQWHHAVGTHNGTTGTLYIDGVSQGSASGASQAYNGYWRIGAYKMQGWTSGSDGYFTGAIDDVRIYDRALASSEVQELYATGGTVVAPLPSAINGSCGVVVNACSAGSLSNGADSSTEYLWSCTGANGGSTASCALPIPPSSSDTTPPTISSISAASVTQTGATISWTTDEVSDTQIEYGLTTSYGNSTSLNASLVTTHSQSLSSLSANTLYHYRVKSKDASGNLTSSGDNTFTTGAVGEESSNGITATTLTRNSGGVNFTWEFNCGGRACRYGKFVNGEYWVVPIDDLGANTGSVTVTNILPAGVTNGAEVNPQGPSKQGILTGYASYEAARNIMTQLPYSASPGQSIFKANTKTSGCGTDAVAAGCVHTDDVLTILATIPPNNGDNVFRPPFHGGWKPLYTTDKVRLERLPSLPGMPGFSASNIVSTWTVPHYDITGNGSYSGEFYRGTSPMAVVDDYAAGQASEYLSHLHSVFGLDSTTAKAPAVYALMQKGIDVYGIFKLGIPFGSGAGQHLGKKPALAFFAAMYDDTSILNEVRAIATNPTYENGGFFQEDSQIRVGQLGVPLWGEVGAVHSYWNRLYPSEDANGATGDPYRYIDGPPGGPAGKNYLGVSGGPIVTFALSQHLMPWLKYADGDAEVLNYADRFYKGYGLTGFDGGFWAGPDPCAPRDPRESTACRPDKLYSTGATGCTYYQVTWGPDPARPGQCIVDADLAYYNSPTDFACQVGKACGRMPTMHDRNVGLGYAPSQLSSMWTSLRTCSDPASVLYRTGLCSGLGPNGPDGNPPTPSVGGIPTIPSSFTLTVVKSGTGTGSVTGGSISCGTTCIQSSISGGTAVTLVAAPSTGATFTGWSGGCTGTGTCALTISSNTSVTANFNTTVQSSDTTAPTAPTNPLLSAISASQMTLSWVASTDAVGVAGYKIYRSNVQVGTSTTNSFAITGLSASTLYSFSVAAYDAAGNVSAKSVSVSATTLASIDTGAPTVPTGIAPSALSDTGVTLSWLASVDSGGVAGYKLYRNGTLIASPTTNSYAVTGLSSNTIYTFTVSAYDAAGNTSGLSLPLSVTTASAPIISRTLSVTKTGAGSGIVSGSTIYCGTSCSTVIVTGTEVTLDASPSSGSEFLGWTGACSGKGECVITIATNTLVGATFGLAPDTIEPSIPTGIIPSSVTQNGIILSWLASVDSGGVAGYKLYRNGTLIASPTTNSYAVTGLSSNTIYTFTVSAYDAAGNTSGLSLPLSVTTASVSVPTYALNAIKTGTGLGIISGSGLNCGSLCLIQVASGSTVTLTANPVGPSTFLGWTGSCSGTGNCTFTMNSNTTAQANFGTIPTASVPVVNPAIPVIPTQDPRATTTIPIITKYLYQGMSDPEVLALQKILVSQGLLTATPTGYFDSATQVSILRFQKERGIQTTGTVGPVTRAALNSLRTIPATNPATKPVTPGAATTTVTTTIPIFTRALTLGSSGTDVKNLQIFLNSHGFPLVATGAGSKGKETMTFSTSTQRALARYQLANRITPSVGYFGVKTLRLVNGMR